MTPVLEAREAPRVRVEGLRVEGLREEVARLAGVLEAAGITAATEADRKPRPRRCRDPSRHLGAKDYTASQPTGNVS